MRRIKYKKAKTSFLLYFIVLIMAVVIITVLMATAFSDLTTTLMGQTIKIPSYVLIFGFSLIVGLVFTYIISTVLIKPIRLIQSAMNKVTEGNLDVRINRKSKFYEINDINQSFNIMMNELCATEILQTDFVSNVSHEFKTPLSAVEGYATLLQSDNLTDEDRKNYTEKILINTRRMSELVGNILLLSKIDNQSIETKKVLYRLDEQIRQSLVLFESKWVEKEIEFDIDLEEISINAAESIYMHIWNNLLSNSIKFSPQGGKISIKLFKDHNFVVYTISDEGKGIKPEEMKHIFDKFYQGDTSHRQEGNGLGLALVKKILDYSDGQISVENNEKGCTFKVKLKNNN